MRIGAARQEHGDHVRVVLGHRPHERRLPAGAAPIEVGAGPRELLCNVRAPGPGRNHDRRLAAQQGEVRIGPRRQQRANHAGAAVLAPRPERGRPEVVRRVDRGAGVEEPPRSVEVVAMTRP